MKLVKITDKFKALEPFIRDKRVLDIGCVDARPDGNKKFTKTGLHIFLKDTYECRHAEYPQNPYQCQANHFGPLK